MQIKHNKKRAVDAFIYEKKFQHHKLCANFVNYVCQNVGLMFHNLI
jgi:hypothetical protein